MSQKDESDVLEELFGGSDEENEVAVKIEEAIEEIKTKTPIKVTRKKSLEEEEVVEELDGTFTILINFTYTCPSDKILEARRDFEEALSKLKGPNHRRKAIDSDSVVKFLIRALLYILFLFLFC